MTVTIWLTATDFYYNDYDYNNYYDYKYNSTTTTTTTTTCSTNHGDIVADSDWVIAGQFSQHVQSSTPLTEVTGAQTWRYQWQVFRRCSCRWCSTTNATITLTYCWWWCRTISTTTTATITTTAATTVRPMLRSCLPTADNKAELQKNNNNNNYYYRY